MSSATAQSTIATVAARSPQTSSCLPPVVNTTLCERYRQPPAADARPAPQRTVRPPPPPPRTPPPQQSTAAATHDDTTSSDAGPQPATAHSVPPGASRPAAPQRHGRQRGRAASRDRKQHQHRHAQERRRRGRRSPSPSPSHGPSSSRRARALGAAAGCSAARPCAASRLSCPPASAGHGHGGGREAAPLPRIVQIVTLPASLLSPRSVLADGRTRCVRGRGPPGRPLATRAPTRSDSRRPRRFARAAAGLHPLTGKPCDGRPADVTPWVTPQGRLRRWVALRCRCMAAAARSCLNARPRLDNRPSSTPRRRRLRYDGYFLPVSAWSQRASWGEAREQGQRGAPPHPVSPCPWRCLACAFVLRPLVTGCHGISCYTDKKHGAPEQAPQEAERLPHKAVKER